MSEHTIHGGEFVAGTQQGDPEKMAYLRNANWQGKTRVQGFKVDSSVCPGCLFPEAKAGRWPHLKDARCAQFVPRVIAQALASARSIDDLLKATQ